MTRIFLTLIAALTPLIADASPVVRARYLMGTTCEITVGSPTGESAIESAFAEATRVEAMLTTWTDSSELARLNAGDGHISPELRALLGRTLEWSDRTGGAFNPRIKALIHLWKTREGGALPDSSAIAAAVERLRVPPAADYTSQAFEEGAFGKGYALDAMLAKLPGESVSVDFGGQIAARGTLSVAIADPRDRDHPVVAFMLTDASLSTSSGSEKTFRINGRPYSHLIDPRTGMALPPRGSASAIADDALTADILSTALYVMGEDDGLRWADANGIAALYITTRNEIRLSSKARERARGLELLDRNFTIKD